MRYLACESVLRIHLPAAAGQTGPTPFTQLSSARVCEHFCFCSYFRRPVLQGSRPVVSWFVYSCSSGAEDLVVLGWL